MARKIRLHRSHRLLCRIGVVVVVVVAAVAAAAPGNRQDLSTVRERERDETRLRIHCCGNGSVQTPRGYQGQPPPPKIKKKTTVRNFKVKNEKQKHAAGTKILK
jgi:hypothetical protein